MNIGEKDYRITICDIETYKALLDIGFYNPDTKEYTEFEISWRKNDLYKFIKFYGSNEYDYLVGFNNISFDQQILEWIYKNYEKWYDKSSIEICHIIYQYTQDLIDNQNYRIFLPFKESSFKIAPIDLFKIHHFDNEAKMTSLKWCAYMMDMNVEELPYFHGLESLTSSQIDEIISYRRNDIAVTERLLYWTIGDCENENYKGKNKIQDRFDVMEETGMPCLNWSDVKIGEEWNKIDYKKSQNIFDDKELFSKKIEYPFGKKFKRYFPEKFKFNDKKLKDFVLQLGEQHIKNEKQEFPITYNNTTYTIAKGGIHSTEKNRFIVCEEGMILRDADIGSQYPNAIRKYKVYPPHLKPIIIEQFSEKIQRRLDLKPLAKKGDKKAQSIQEMLKLCMNGGWYGKLNQPGSFLTYPEGYMKVSIGNQIEILMLIEMMEMEGISVISGNTDGILCYFPTSKEEKYYIICKEWEELVGNTLLGKLEYTDFEAIYQESINHYIAKCKDGKIKRKGRFLTEYELHKNKSFRIIPLALNAYFIDNIPVETFIKSHTNIFDFCGAQKATRSFHYEGYNPLTKEQSIYNKLIRYYVSIKGEKLLKIKNENCETNAAKVSQVEAGEWLCKVCNTNKFSEDELNNINYKYYLEKINEIIYKIENGRKPIITKAAENQMSLF